MFRPASRLIARSSAMRALPRAAAPRRRLISTAPPSQKSRSWKSLAARFGIAGALLYYYNTTEVFAEEPRQAYSLPETTEETEQLPTVEDLAKERQQRRAEIAARQRKEAESAQETAAAPADGVEGLEEEAGQQGAFNPETGEINWDCPCLGGMADGPCGEEFKSAFSCFVFSTEEPKGMDCIDKFKNMQTCFRQYPEIYGAELETDEEDDVTADTPLGEGPDGPAVGQERPQSQPSSQPQDHSLIPNSSPKHSMVPDSYRPDADSKTESAKTTTDQVGTQPEEPVNHA